MTTKREIKAWIAKIERHRAEVAKARDRLNESIDEMESLRDCCERAHQDLENAIEALSELA